jgi:nuclear pore complex protein Nup93
MDSTGLIPLDGDVAKITRRADEFRELHEALQRNLPTYLTLTMDAIAGIHARVKAAGVNDATRQMVRRTQDAVCGRS